MAKLALIAILVMLVAMVSHMGWSHQKPATANHDETNERKKRFVNGEDTAPHEFPWTVLIVMVFNNIIQRTCTGSLIFPQVVLTAGHCLWNNRTPGHIPNGLSAVVYPGQHKNPLKGLKGRYAPRGVNSMALILPPLIKPYKDYRYYDYGVIILSKRLKKSRTVDFIVLANSSSPSPQKLTCFAAGFGLIDSSNKTVLKKLEKLSDEMKLWKYVKSLHHLRPDVLQKMMYFMLPMKICYSHNQTSDHVKQLQPAFFCGMTGTHSPYYYTGLYDGDDGGPLMCRWSQTEPWILYGVISSRTYSCFGHTQYHECPMIYGGGFANFASVPAISNWLMEIGSAYELQHQTRFGTTSTTKATSSSFRAPAVEVRISESRHEKWNLNMQLDIKETNDD